MWTKIKNFITDRDLYTTDAKKILTVHNILQTINIIVSALGMIASLFYSIDEGFSWDFGEGLAIFLSSSLAIVLYFIITKVSLNISFGWLYDLRILRMNSEPKEKVCEASKDSSKSEDNI